MNALVCLGLGYCARYYVAEFGSRFNRITGTSRTSGKQDPAAGEMLVFDGVQVLPELRAAIADATHLLMSATPGETGDPVLGALGDDIAAAPSLHSAVYLSSLGVYGDHGGAWIDETTPTIPPHTRGAARVDAELAWQALGRKRNTPVAILRLGGIYGPGQNAFVRLLAGRAHRIDKPGHVSNRIHVRSPLRRRRQRHRRRARLAGRADRIRGKAPGHRAAAPSLIRRSHAHAVAIPDELL
jgi:hypothetical protein